MWNFHLIYYFSTLLGTKSFIHTHTHQKTSVFFFSSQLIVLVTVSVLYWAKTSRPPGRLFSSTFLPFFDGKNETKHSPSTALLPCGCHLSTGVTCSQRRILLLLAWDMIGVGALTDPLIAAVSAHLTGASPFSLVAILNMPLLGSTSLFMVTVQTRGYRTSCRRQPSSRHLGCQE